VSAAWVAASVRATLLERRRLGARGARALAATDSASAIRALASGPYRDEVTPTMSVVEAQRAVAASLLWRLRMLAGWVPPGGTSTVQALAAWFEIVNVQERLAYFAGGPRPELFRLGRLAVAWPALERATSPDVVRSALAASRWGDPGGVTDEAIVNWMRLAWAAWVARSVPAAAGWAEAGRVLLAARLVTAGQVDPNLERSGGRGLRRGWTGAGSLDVLSGFISQGASSVLEGVAAAEDLWLAEAGWWKRVSADAARLLVASRYSPDVVVAAVALSAHDTWLVRAALTAADGDAVAKETFAEAA